MRQTTTTALGTAIVTFGGLLVLLGLLLAVAVVASASSGAMPFEVILSFTLNFVTRVAFTLPGLLLLLRSGSAAAAGAATLVAAASAVSADVYALVGQASGDIPLAYRCGAAIRSVGGRGPIGPFRPDVGGCRRRVDQAPG